MDDDHGGSPVPPETLADWVADAGRRTAELVADLTDDQLRVPRLATINPLLWELGHLAWFTEKWVLRHAGRRPPLRADADALYDSAAVPHATRWDMPLPSRADTLAYLDRVRQEVLDVVARGPSRCEAYFVLLSVFHEDMHGEAFLYTRQTLGYPRPALSGPLAPSPPGPGAGRGPEPEASVRAEARGHGPGSAAHPHPCSLAHASGSGRLAAKTSTEPSPPAPRAGSGPLSGDVEIPGGAFQLGATPAEPFVFDNEKWAHPVELRPFAVARAPVTQAEFAAFVEDQGYDRRDFWSDAGWRWRVAAGARHPVYWERAGGGWRRRDFDRWVPLEPDRPVIHVNWYEADAYCRWAGRRLPTEAEWEAAAAAGGELSAAKRRFPWGDDPPDADRANLDGRALGCCDVADRPAGDSAFGCRQMIGNVWEWTASDFGPYPGFVADPYQEYSQPWFGTHKVLRGGAWPTRARLLRNTWRNFYTPDRRDVWAGFRTCALRA